MAIIKSFEDLEIWKLSMQQAAEVYKNFKDCKDFSFKDQIQRAAVSVASNIAEGFERNTNKEFIQFLYIAKGSNGELITQLYLAVTFKYIDTKKGKELIEKSKTLSAKIGKLINYRKKYNKEK
ncbi:MAG: four helix bundle protein [Prevotellaceae bacterium]|jgi:four helix bundle protein|nr:four helix bundle protein [Prevotellaceae bacterium]